MISPLAAVLVLLWSGLTAADQRALGGRQIHQPIVAAVVAGLILGDPQRGLLVGVWFQLVWSIPLPVGGTILPDTGTTAVAATIFAVLLPFEFGLLLAILLGLLIAYGSIHWERHLRGRNQVSSDSLLAGDVGRLNRYVLMGLLGPFTRGVAIAGGAIACAVGLAVARRQMNLGFDTIDIGLGTALLGGAAAVGIASIFNHVRIEAGTRASGWILGGLVLGIALRLVVGLGS